MPNVWTFFSPHESKQTCAFQNLQAYWQRRLKLSHWADIATPNFRFILLCWLDNYSLQSNIQNSEKSPPNLASLMVRQSVVLLHIRSLEGKMDYGERFFPISARPPRFNLDDTNMTWQGVSRREASWRSVRCQSRSRFCFHENEFHTTHFCQFIIWQQSASNKIQSKLITKFKFAKLLEHIIAIQYRIRI